MAAPQMEQKQVQGEFSTAEVTHVMEALRMEGQCYIKNHILMNLSGVEGPIREWHDNVTRANIDRFKGLAKEMGIAMPFPKPLEDRENEIKSSLQGQNVGGTLTEGECLAEIKIAGMQLSDFYAISMNLSTHDKCRDAFRRAFETVADNVPRVEQALKNTPQYHPPPNAQQVQIVGKTGTPPT